MKDTLSKSNLVSTFNFLSKTVNLLVFLVAFMVLAGWQMDNAFLKSIFPNTVAMNPVTAVLFLFSCATLYLLQRKETDKHKYIIRNVCAILIIFCAAVKLVGYFTGWDFQMDQILFHSKLDAIANVIPNRMAPNTAFNFLLIGFAILFLDRAFDRSLRRTQTLCLLTASIGLLAMIGYIYGVKFLYGIASYIPMAFNTALCFVMLSLGILMARPDRGIMIIFTSDSMGGIIARRLLPAAVGIPIIFGELKIWGEHMGYYDPAFGTSLLVLFLIIFFVILFWTTAKTLHWMDNDRRRIEKSIALLNQDLQSQKVQLENTNKELESFSYSVSHDLRAPLRTIDGFSQAVLEDYVDKLDEQGKDYLQRVRLGAQRMARLIDDLLMLSRIGRKEIFRETVNLSALAQSVISELQQRYTERAVEFVIAPNITTTGDNGLLRIVLVNLLGNAWKFTSKNNHTKIEVGSLNKNGKLVYYIKDNGVGFDQAHAGKLFGAFQRLHSDRDFEGTGIGLSIVQRIIKRHGGEIWAESQVGQGATFYFTLQ